MLFWVMELFMSKKTDGFAYTTEDIQELLQDFHIVKIQPSHYAFSGPFEMATGVVDFQRALELEDLLRHHPIAKDLNRAWMVVAQKK